MQRENLVIGIGSQMPRSVIGIYVIALIAFASTMFSRVLVSGGAPSIVNFLHFAVVPGMVAFVLIIIKSLGRATLPLVIAVVLLLLAIAASALVNDAGLINAVLEALLLSEPFAFLYLMVSAKWSRRSIKGFKVGLMAVATTHVAFSYFQWGVMGATHDEVTGLFVGMSAGSHVAGAVALSFAVYLLTQMREKTIGFVLVFQVSVLSAIAIVADAKQVIAVFLASLAALIIFGSNGFGQRARILCLSMLSGAMVFALARTIFPSLLAWAEIDVLEQALIQKLSVFKIISANFTSQINWIFGLGPGHTVGRLGSLLPEYYDHLRPLGATISPVTSMVWDAHQGHYMSNSITGSSMFSLFFSWVGVWGDLGFLGLAIYFVCWVVVWKNFAVDMGSRFLLTTILIFGLVFSWMEEPGYMLFVMSLIGLRWQEQRLHAQPQ